MTSPKIIIFAFAFCLTINSISSSPINEDELQSSRSYNENFDILEKLEKYIKSHDFSIDVPSSDSKLIVSARNLDNDELNLKLKVSGGAVESRKSKLKKIFIPIFVFLLLKAITVIPLALGVLGLKAWNSLQLSFFSFMISTGLAIFQLCKKLATDHHHPQLVAPWESARNFVDELLQSHLDNQDVVYNAHA